MAISTAFDPQVFRTVLGHYPTGVCVVTGVHPDGTPLAMVVGTFSSVSLDPPLVSFLPMKTSGTYQQLAECTSMCINVLTADQEGLGREIATRRSDKLAGLDWRPSPSGAPILTDCLAWLDVRLEQAVEAGDHLIALCRVDHLAVENPVAPLLFFQGGYGAFVVPSLVARIDADIAAGVHEAVASRAELEALAQDLDCECTLLKVVNREEMAAVGMATGPGKSPDSGLGARLPIIPPIADAWAAWLPEDEQDYWLSKAAGADETRREIYRRRLEFCREEGFVYSRCSGEEVTFASLQEATTRYASTRPTPAEVREIRERITEATSPEAYALTPLVDEERYDIASIIVPVSDARGEKSLNLRVSDLPRRTTGTEVRSWVDAIKTTARDIEVSLRATDH